MGLNGVPMARHGLILSQDGATNLRNLFKYLPAPRDTIFGPKITKKNSKFNFLRILPIIGPLTPIGPGREYHLRELVRTHVILAPGACGRWGPIPGSGTGSTGSAGSGGSAG